MKLIKKKYFYVKDGKEMYLWRFYIRLENGQEIQIKPSSYVNKQGITISSYLPLIISSIEE